MQAEPIINQALVLGGDELNTALLRKMALEAESYITSFVWCERLIKGKFVDGYGGIFALFLFRADIKELGKGAWIWVLVGDLPKAYLEAKDFPAPLLAAKRYIAGVREWMSAVQNGQSTSDLIPIDCRRDTESLAQLEMRLHTLEELVIPQLSNEPLRLLGDDE